METYKPRTACRFGWCLKIRKGQLVKVHQPQPEGGRSTDPAEDQVVASRYTTRVPDQIISEAAQMGPSVDRFV